MLNNRNNLFEVMNVQTASYESERMERFITRRIKKMNLRYERDTYGNIYVTKGHAKLYPTMACHIDTVHDVNLNVRVYQTPDAMFAMDTAKMEQYGIGGDDKVGVYITLQMLQHFDNFKAVFFKDEEVGCIGSSQANFTFFDNSTIVLQCDRQGQYDFVNNISNTKLFDDTLLQDIQAILDNANRKVVTGGLTDVLQIARNNKVQVANMSCGYYNPHQDNEYINIHDVFATEKLCANIFKATQHKRYTIEENRTTTPQFVYNTHDYYNSYYNKSYHNNYNTLKHYEDNHWNKYKPTNTKVSSTDTNAQCYCGSCGQPSEFDEFEGAIFCQDCYLYTYIEPQIDTYHD